jgi:Uri superfamily endonuclease
VGREPTVDYKTSSKEGTQHVFSYVFILRCGDTLVKTGSSEAFLSSGYYVYLGSANIKQPYLRVLRHFIRGGKKLKWHIDYLTVACDPAGALLCSGVSENTLYEILKRLDYLVPSVKGFGCSDYRGTHETHLFKFGVGVGSPYEVVNYFTSVLKKHCSEVELILG